MLSQSTMYMTFFMNLKLQSESKVLLRKFWNAMLGRLCQSAKIFIPSEWQQVPKSGTCPEKF